MTKSFNVFFLNRKKTIKVKEYERILKIASKNKIILPIGCNFGACISCAAKLIKGKVRQPGATALNKRQIKEGYILLCVSIPISDCIIEEGVESHQNLYQNPFKSFDQKR